MQIMAFLVSINERLQDVFSAEYRAKTHNAMSAI